VPPRAFLSPEEMFPAGRIKLRVWRLRLASGLRVRIVETGEDAAPPVVFIPGWGCSTYIFRETLTAVAFAGFRVIAVELKGHGLSDKPSSPDEYTTDAMCRHLSEIIDALDAGPVHLVGHSMGAAIAAHTAAIAPDKVISLVLVAPVGFAGVPGMSVLRTVTPNSSLAMIRRLTTHGMVRRLLGFVYGRRRRANERDVEEFRAPVQFLAFVRAMRHLLHRFEWRSAFPSLSIPWITLLGSEDFLSPVADAHLFRGPGSAMAVTVIKGAGHVIFDEAPELVNPALTLFLTGRR